MNQCKFKLMPILQKYDDDTTIINKKRNYHCDINTCLYQSALLSSPLWSKGQKYALMKETLYDISIYRERLTDKIIYFKKPND